MHSDVNSTDNQELEQVVQQVAHFRAQLLRLGIPLDLPDNLPPSTQLALLQEATLGALAQERHGEAAVRESEAWLRVTLSSIGDAVIATDTAGGVIFLNPVAESLTGWLQRDAVGQPSQQIFTIINEQTREPADDIVARVLREQATNTLANHTALLTRDGREVPIEDSAAPITDSAGAVVGAVLVFHDVTARRRAQEALRESEERLHFAMETSHIGAWDLDLVDHTAFRSLEHDRIFGYPALLPRWTYEMFLDHVLPEDRTLVASKFQHAIDTRSDWNFECRIRRTDGAVRWIWAAGRHQTDASGTVRRMAGIVQDITERKQDQEHLRESEERFRTLANALPQLAWIAQPDGYIYWYNQRWYAYTGTTPEEMEGWGWQRVHDPAVLPAVLEQWKSSIATGQPFDMDFPLRGADGRYRQFLTHVQPLKDAEGHVVQWFGTNTDITERKQAEEALQQYAENLEVMSEELRAQNDELLQGQEEREHLLSEVQRRVAELDATLDSIADGVLIYDPDGHIVHMNEIAAALLSYTSAESALLPAQRLPLRWYERLDGTRIAPEELPLIRALRGETTRGELAVLYTPASKIWVTLSAAPIYMPDGRMQGAIVTMKDITPLHKAQERERHYLYTLAHNLRVPATIIQGNLQLLLEELTPDCVQPHQPLVEALKRGLHRMSTMIDDFTLVTRLEEGPILLNTTPVVLSSYLPALLQRYTPVLETSRIHLALPADLPPVLADPKYLQTIFLSLLGNAQKFSAVDTPIQVSAQQRDGEVEIAITDQGIGIVPEDLPHIFDRFYRVEHMRKAEGTGLGLYITKRLVEAHSLPAVAETAKAGGCIGVESTMGKGSTFFFTLPVAQA